MCHPLIDGAALCALSEDPKSITKHTNREEKTC